MNASSKNNKYELSSFLANSKSESLSASRQILEKPEDLADNALPLASLNFFRYYTHSKDNPHIKEDPTKIAEHYHNTSRIHYNLQAGEISSTLFGKYYTHDGVKTPHGYCIKTDDENPPQLIRYQNGVQMDDFKDLKFGKVKVILNNEKFYWKGYYYENENLSICCGKGTLEPLAPKDSYFIKIDCFMDNGQLWDEECEIALKVTENIGCFNLSINYFGSLNKKDLTMHGGGELRIICNKFGEKPQKFILEPNCDENTVPGKFSSNTPNGNFKLSLQHQTLKIKYVNGIPQSISSLQSPNNGRIITYIMPHSLITSIKYTIAEAITYITNLYEKLHLKPIMKSFQEDQKSCSAYLNKLKVLVSQIKNFYPHLEQKNQAVNEAKNAIENLEKLLNEEFNNFTDIINSFKSKEHKNSFNMLIDKIMKINDIVTSSPEQQGFFYISNSKGQTDTESLLENTKIFCRPETFLIRDEQDFKEYETQIKNGNNLLGIVTIKLILSRILLKLYTLNNPLELPTYNIYSGINRATFKLSLDEQYKFIPTKELADLKIYNPETGLITEFSQQYLKPMILIYTNSSVGYYFNSVNYSSSRIKLSAKIILLINEEITLVMSCKIKKDQMLTLMDKKLGMALCLPLRKHPDHYLLSKLISLNHEDYTKIFNSFNAGDKKYASKLMISYGNNFIYTIRYYTLIILFDTKTDEFRVYQHHQMHKDNKNFTNICILESTELNLNLIPPEFIINKNFSSFINSNLSISLFKNSPKNSTKKDILITLAEKYGISLIPTLKIKTQHEKTSFQANFEIIQQFNWHEIEVPVLYTYSLSKKNINWLHKDNYFICSSPIPELQSYDLTPSLKVKLYPNQNIKLEVISGNCYFEVHQDLSKPYSEDCGVNRIDQSLVVRNEQGNLHSKNQIATLTTCSNKSNSLLILEFKIYQPGYHYIRLSKGFRIELYKPYIDEKIIILEDECDNSGRITERFWVRYVFNHEERRWIEETRWPYENDPGLPKPNFLQQRFNVILFEPEEPRKIGYLTPPQDKCLLRIYLPKQDVLCTRFDDAIFSYPQISWKISEQVLDKDKQTKKLYLNLTLELEEGNRQTLVYNLEDLKILPPDLYELAQEIYNTITKTKSLSFYIKAEIVQYLFSQDIALLINYPYEKEQLKSEIIKFHNNSMNMHRSMAAYKISNIMENDNGYRDLILERWTKILEGLLFSFDVFTTHKNFKEFIDTILFIKFAEDPKTRTHSSSYLFSALRKLIEVFQITLLEEAVEVNSFFQSMGFHDDELKLLSPVLKLSSLTEDLENHPYALEAKLPYCAFFLLNCLNKIHYIITVEPKEKVVKLYNDLYVLTLNGTVYRGEKSHVFFTGLETLLKKYLPQESQINRMVPVSELIDTSPPLDVKEETKQEKLFIIDIDLINECKGIKFNLNTALRQHLREKYENNNILSTDFKEIIEIGEEQTLIVKSLLAVLNEEHRKNNQYLLLMPGIFHDIYKKEGEQAVMKVNPNLVVPIKFFDSYNEILTIEAFRAKAFNPRDKWHDFLVSIIESVLPSLKIDESIEVYLKSNCSGIKLNYVENENDQINSSIVCNVKLKADKLILSCKGKKINITGYNSTTREALAEEIKKLQQISSTLNKSTINERKECFNNMLISDNLMNELFGKFNHQYALIKIKKDPGRAKIIEAIREKLPTPLDIKNIKFSIAENIINQSQAKDTIHKKVTTIKNLVHKCLDFNMHLPEEMIRFIIKYYQIRINMCIYNFHAHPKTYEIFITNELQKFIEEMDKLVDKKKQTIIGILFKMASDSYSQELATLNKETTPDEAIYILLGEILRYVFNKFPNDKTLARSKLEDFFGALYKVFFKLQKEYLEYFLKNKKFFLSVDYCVQILSFSLLYKTILY